MRKKRAREICCPVCEEAVTDQYGLARHCGSFHKNEGADGKSQDYTVIKVFSKSYVEFEKWLTEQCDRTCTSFRRRSSHAAPGGGISYNLRCSRARGYAKNGCRQSINKKPNKYCSCFLNVHVDDHGVVTARGCFGHAGHDIEVPLLHLSHEQENFLKDLLKVHSIDYVMDRLKQDYPSKTSRLHHVTRADLRNILQKYGLTPIPSDNDCVDLSTKNEEKCDTSNVNVIAESDADLRNNSKVINTEEDDDLKDLQDVMAMMDCEPVSDALLEIDPSLFNDDKDEIFTEIMKSSSSLEEEVPQLPSDLSSESDIKESPQVLIEHPCELLPPSPPSSSSLRVPLEPQEDCKSNEHDYCDPLNQSLGVHSFTKDEANPVGNDIPRERRSTKDAREAAKVLCPICGNKLHNYVSLAEHCANSHSSDGAGGDPQDYTVFQRTFDSFAEYEEWLLEQCERTCTSFYRQSTVRGKNMLRLRCNRSGRYVSGSSKRTKSSKKQTRNCSCFLNVRVKDNGAVAVLGCFGHVGHKVDVSLIRLSHSQEKYLKELLEVYPVGYIFTFLKKEYPATSRLYHVTRSDLRNIMARHQIRPVSRDAMGGLTVGMSMHDLARKAVEAQNSVTNSDSENAQRANADLATASTTLSRHNLNPKPNLPIVKVGTKLNKVEVRFPLPPLIRFNR
ncbi:hypothetical protein GCK32_005272 [Trichostrongylus colubriformis]|uniref:C2H2-type domain-containing protein n=1 Tax=Trichostrongylus colubriformis TaxID=6319 RepID=A0AAN8J2Q1_TRICO